jgi:hypothetical protein
LRDTLPYQAYDEPAMSDPPNLYRRRTNDVTRPVMRHEETCYFDREEGKYKPVPRTLPDAVAIGSRVLEASQALHDSPEVRAIEAAGLGDEYRRIIGRIAAAAARAVSADLDEATWPAA